MSRYIALLRGINVSGKNKIVMAELKTAFSELGYENVKTHLNSGNIVFDAEHDDGSKHDSAGADCTADACVSYEKRIGEMISSKFGLDIPVFVIKQDELKDLLAAAPSWWGTEDKKIYDNLIFVLHGFSAAEIAEKIGETSAELEQVLICGDAIFWSFDRAKYAKANWWKKTAMPGIGEKLTIRTAGTLRKIAAM